MANDPPIPTGVARSPSDAPPSADERRAAERAPVSLEVRWRAVGKSELDLTRDLSSTGAFLRCRGPLPLGSRVEVLLPHPSGQGSLLVDGEVVRVHWGGRDHGRRLDRGMALHFIDLSDDDRAALIELVEVARASAPGAEAG